MLSGTVWKYLQGGPKKIVWPDTYVATRLALDALSETGHSGRSRRERPVGFSSHRFDQNRGNVGKNYFTTPKFDCSKN
ncbi:hypothetical protein L596_002626 [Steinernema carpocapsae]|uniref:Uncharacterized protein n=1 Tax=Steinernema carpocapsae TaxID=34508 RepID=A0A4U8UQ32_STECR|nr:hypothetical protein L596_002626 [Steinernema carpocapsae]